MATNDVEYEALVDEPMFPRDADCIGGYGWKQFERDFYIKSSRDLGSGAFGTVVKCCHRATDQEFALKIFTDPLFDDELESHIVREHCIMRNLGQPGHQFILKLYAITEAPDMQQYFILELAPNRDLNYWIHSKFRGIDALHINCVRFYAAEVVLALEYMRSKHIVHRDIKAENILLDSNFHIKVCDFGCAKKISDSRQALNLKFLRKKNKKIGHPLFIAPECWYKEELTYSTDLWNLGYLIFDMYAGGPICIDSREKKKKRYERIQNGDYKWPHAQPREDVMDVVSQLTRRKASDRIGSEDLQNLKDHPFFTDINFEELPIQTPPPMAPSDELPERRLARRRRQEQVHPLPHVIQGAEPPEGPEGACGGASAIPEHFAFRDRAETASPPINLLDMPIPEFKDPTLPPPML